MRQWKEMPTAIRGLIFLFSLIPLLSLFFGASSTLLLIASYWVAPLLLCFAIVAVHYLLFPFYLFECLALLAHSSGYAHASSTDIWFSRTILLIMMIYIDIFFTNKDLAYPFLTLKNRSWRKHPRKELHLPIELCSSGDWTIPALVKNCSAGGMAVSLYKKDFSKLLGHQRGDILIAIVKTAVGTISIPMEVAWIAPGPKFQVGLSAVDPAMMKGLLRLAQNEPFPTSTRFPGSSRWRNVSV